MTKTPHTHTYTVLHTHHIMVLYCCSHMPFLHQSANVTHWTLSSEANTHDTKTSVKYNYSEVKKKKQKQ